MGQLSMLGRSLWNLNQLAGTITGKDLETNLSIFTRKLLTVLLELSKAERSVEHNQVAADGEAYHKSCFRQPWTMASRMMSSLPNGEIKTIPSDVVASESMVTSA